MEYLGLSILASSTIFVIFKLYTKYRIQTLYAIIVNYFIACAVGLYFYRGDLNFNEISQKPWFLGTVGLGLLFIVVFNLMALTSQKIGVSAASVATKMSLAIPVIFGVWVYEDVMVAVCASTADWADGERIENETPNRKPGTGSRKPGIRSYRADLRRSETSGNLRCRAQRGHGLTTRTRRSRSRSRRSTVGSLDRA